ncbi:hypothetical protein QTP88_023596 [Uroleucon formosanum]
MDNLSACSRLARGPPNILGRLFQRESQVLVECCYIRGVKSECGSSEKEGKMKLDENLARWRNLPASQRHLILNGGQVDSTSIAGQGVELTKKMKLGEYSDIESNDNNDEWDQLNLNETFTSYVNVDKNLEICGEWTENDIISDILDEDNEEEIEDQQIQSTIPNKEAKFALETLRKYIEGNEGMEDLFKPLVQFHQCKESGQQHSQQKKDNIDEETTISRSTSTIIGEYAELVQDLRLSANMTDDLPALTIRRGTLKGRITKFIKFLQDFAIDGDVSQIRVRKQKIEECWDEFQNIQSAIEVKVTNEAAAAVEENYRFEFEDLYFQAIADSEKMLNKTGHNINQNISNSELPGSTASSHQASIVKLAALNVPQFSGNYKEWSTFNDMFTALIHSNEALTEVQKFFYLKAALSGDAAEVVKCFETSAKNYKIAWDCLNERFNNKRIMVQAHTKAIFDLESITEESSGKLRQFVDKLFSHIKALEAIGYNPISWGPMLLHIISIKLDHATLRAWETQAPKTEVPKVEELIAFLKGRFQILESIENAQGLHKFGNGLSQMPITDNKLKGNIKPKTKSLFAHTTVVKFKCYVCEEPHAIYKCKQFLDLTVKERRENVIKLKLCTNCLSKHKENSKCKSKGCRKCGELHNTLLHENVAEQNVETAPSTSISAHAASAAGTKVLLSTAIIKIFSSSNEPFLARALLDSASQGNFITNNLANKLRLAKHKFDCAISGVNSSECRVSHVVTAEVRARSDAYTRSINFMTLPKITSKLPTGPIYLNNSYAIPEYIEFADPTYAKPGEIDLLLGAEVFFDTLRSGQYKPMVNGLVYQETAFGWVVAGSVQQYTRDVEHTFVAQTIPSDCCQQLEKQISNFWRLEELGKVECHSLEEKQCIEHFKKTVTKGSDGRFIVQLPFKENPINIGRSKAIALKRFMSNENRLRVNPKLKEAYLQFINEYIELGHMEQVSDNNENDKPVYYIPHHAVLRDNSLTTKLRVVFDASCATDTRKSLNDILLKGPSIQDDLINIISRFRTHKYAMSADIEKMYRQIWIAEKDRDLQRVLWRENPAEEVKEYRLNTVTYGTSSASYLATACLKMLADDTRSLFPEASSAVASDFYMDDYLGGAQTIDAAIKLRDGIVKIVNKCVICFKTKPFTFQPVMGDLPKERIQPGRAFATTGMDFAGPVKIKVSTRRNAQTLKAYICVFVCFATKAVHIELVSDLSTDAFLAALRRFWSRRGYCATLWSDNGKNFVGANRRLKELRDLFSSKDHQAKVQRCVSEVGINWKFIPVYSPHFGGLWESAVKSIKHHLIRQLGNAVLTFEELYTILSRIEACLNSRPLSPLSPDPSDLNVLTPGHFLVGGSLTCLPEQDMANVPANRLRRWQLVTQLTQQIWQRWNREYLSQLQERTKWSSKIGPTTKKGMLVIIREPNLAPTQWRLGRVVDLHAAPNEVIHVVTVRTERGNSKQAVRNLCPLPLDD